MFKKSKKNFVLIWVDGNDPEWRKEKDKHDPNVNEENSSNSEVRYRDWDNLQYWFRGVEQYAPWVNKIYFITCGQIPEWLNTDNEKIAEYSEVLLRQSKRLKKLIIKVILPLSLASIFQAIRPTISR